METEIFKGSYIKEDAQLAYPVQRVGHTDAVLDFRIEHITGKEVKEN